MIYADSGFYIALLDDTDDASEYALQLFDAFLSDHHLRLITTRAVLNEFLAHFSRGVAATRLRAVDFAKDVLRNPKYSVVPIDDTEYWEAILLYEARPDKRYSMVDCIGMTVMRRQGIQDVVATDRDFEQEGFTNLMIPDRRRGVS